MFTPFDPGMLKNIYTGQCSCYPSAPLPTPTILYSITSAKPYSNSRTSYKRRLQNMQDQTHPILTCLLTNIDDPMAQPYITMQSCPYDGTYISITQALMQHRSTFMEQIFTVS